MQYVGRCEDPEKTRWRDGVGGGEFELGRAQIVAYGLTDKLRAALYADVEAVVRPVPVKPVPVEAEVPPVLESGEFEGWRWQRVEDGDRVLWAVDNKPACKDWDLLGAPEQECPRFQSVVLPDGVFQAILASRAS